MHKTHKKCIKHVFIQKLFIKMQKKVLHNWDQGGIIWVISREAYKSAGLS